MNKKFWVIQKSVFGKPSDYIGRTAPTAKLWFVSAVWMAEPFESERVAEDFLQEIESNMPGCLKEDLGGYYQISPIILVEG